MEKFLLYLELKHYFIFLRIKILGLALIDPPSQIKMLMLSGPYLNSIRYLNFN